MAPEVYEETNDAGLVLLSQKADVYSFGVMLVSLFVGELGWGEELPSDRGALLAKLKEFAMRGVRPVVPSTVQVSALQALNTTRMTSVALVLSSESCRMCQSLRFH
jgi:maleate cis-trans isomerase